MALVYPNMFLAALNYAGAFGAVVLFGILPALMAWCGRYRQGLSGTFRVVGGKVTLVAVIIFAFMVMGMQFLLDNGS
jgi:tyrosine-specific transport protein